MLGRNKPVYQPTTYQVPNGPKSSSSSYLPSSQGAFCGGKKRRLQLLFLSFGVILISLSILALGSVISGLYSSSALVGVLLLSLFLLLLGAWMVVLYLRTRGRCNFSFWPNRAAVLSQQLTGDDGRRRSGGAQSSMTRGSQEEESLMPSEGGGPSPKIVSPA